MNTAVYVHMVDIKVCERLISVGISTGCCVQMFWVFFHLSENLEYSKYLGLRTCGLS